MYTQLSLMPSVVVSTDAQQWYPICADENGCSHDDCAVSAIPGAGELQAFRHDLLGDCPECGRALLGWITVDDWCNIWQRAERGSDVRLRAWMMIFETMYYMIEGHAMKTETQERVMEVYNAIVGVFTKGGGYTSGEV
jgi:hypothetical protein